ncbi:MAG: polysaccharide pyruvyl transferase CsaB [Syntrophomonadaceae bacterium]|jgi:polysaccharide pyruvyl transferase CsaB|nr:polysaccharide pyruvyl transferase CsaB [Syntrophomonadaceae bacterium]
MKIALSGYYGFDNAGDEALLAAITGSIRKHNPNTDFVVFSGNPAGTTSAHHIQSVYYLNPLKVLRELIRSDLLISGGGSIFQDVTSGRSLPYYISVVALAKFLRKPVIFYAQGVGPINRPLSKFLMRKIANKVDMITLRDEASRRLLHDIGVTGPPQIITADPVFTLKTSRTEYEAAERLLASHCTQGKIIGVAVRKWDSLYNYQQSLARVLDQLSASGFEILFVPFHWPDDVKESQNIMGLMNSQARIINEQLNTSSLLALSAKFHLMIGMRLHALIFAASQETVFAGISYDPKIDGFLKLYDTRPLSLEPETMFSEIDSLLNNNSLRDSIVKRSVDMRDKAEKNAILALSLLKGRLVTEIQT